MLLPTRNTDDSLAVFPRPFGSDKFYTYVILRGMISHSLLLVDVVDDILFHSFFL